MEFELEFAPEIADGRWFYVRDDEAINRSKTDPSYEEFWEDYSDTDSDDDDVGVWENGPIKTNMVKRERFRSLPDTNTFLPFVTSASQFVSRVPSLRKFILKMYDMCNSYGDLSHYPIVSRVFELWYLKAGMCRSPAVAAPLDFSKTFVRVPGDANYLHRNRLYWRVDRWQPWDEVQVVWRGVAGPEGKVVFLDKEY